MHNSAFRYNDENDRSLGLAGSAIAIVVWNGEDKLTALSIDSNPGEGIEMTPDFGFSGNPRLSARLAWQLMLKQLELTSAMVMGNVMCRSYVGAGRPLSSSSRSTLRALIRDEAVNACSLDDDETEVLFNRLLDYQNQLFSHPEVAAMARNLAADIRSQRRLSVTEILDRLDRLGRL